MRKPHCFQGVRREFGGSYAVNFTGIGFNHPGKGHGIHAQRICHGAQGIRDHIRGICPAAVRHRRQVGGVCFYKDMMPVNDAQGLAYTVVAFV